VVGYGAGGDAVADFWVEVCGGGDQGYGGVGAEEVVDSAGCYLCGWGC